MRRRPSIAVTENFAHSANLAEFVAELKLRPKRPKTLGRFPSATSTCAAAIRRSEKDRQMAAAALTNNGVVRYSAAVAELLITSSALVQLLLFDHCEWGMETDGRAGDVPSSGESVAAMVVAAVAALSKDTAVVVSVGCDANANRVRGTFDVPIFLAGSEGGGDESGNNGGGGGGQAILRAATLQGTMFKYKPPEGWATSIDVVKRWVIEGIVGSAAKPYLTGADRVALLAMMRSRSRGDL